MTKKYPPLELVAPLMFALVFVIMLIYSRFEPHVDDVDAAYIREHYGKAGYVLIDVRPEESYMGKSPRAGIPGGHIPGAVSFPFANLSGNTQIVAALLAKEGITKDKTVITYCNTGVSSGRMADQLGTRFKFSPLHVKHYRGSIVDWIKDPKNILLPEDHESSYTHLEEGQ